MRRGAKGSRQGFWACSGARSWSCAAALGLAACLPRPQAPATLAEQSTSYTYIPLDPLAVVTTKATNCIELEKLGVSITYKNLLESFPDQAARIAVGKVDASGSLVFGPFQASASRGAYQVVLDYVNVDTRGITMWVRRTTSEGKPISVFASYSGDSRYEVLGSESSLPSDAPPADAELVVFPVYIGIGLRLTASVVVSEAGAKLSSLGALAAEAKAGKLSGSLVVQTLGVSGRTVSTALPLPSDLSEATVQQAILALASIKAALYDSTTQVEPRVVGIYNPIGGGQQVVNGVISALSRRAVTWPRPCANPLNLPVTRGASPDQT